VGAVMLMMHDGLRDGIEMEESRPDNSKEIVSRRKLMRKSARGTCPRAGLGRLMGFVRFVIGSGSCRLCPTQHPSLGGGGAGVGAASVMWAKLTRTPPPLFLRYPQLQRRYAPSRLRTYSITAYTRRHRRRLKRSCYRPQQTRQDASACCRSQLRGAPPHLMRSR